MSAPPVARRLSVSGVVQAVGFRPWVWGRARELGLRGWVRNTSSGVEIVVEGAPSDVEAFILALRDGGPPLARVDRLEVAETTPGGLADFAILPSRPEPGASLPVSPDLAICDDCLRELRDPDDRRHRYPFVNCTNCGPRFTIVRDVPYDRPLTTMATFPLCADCAREYADPADRRFHAQPVACAACGPHAWLEVGGAVVARRDDALRRARELLAAGATVAVKGVGGFHLACDATSPAAVARLRGRKQRADKPLALMAADLAAVERHAVVGGADRALLLSPARPVVLLPRRADAALASDVAPDRDRVGFMLAYTPLHHLLLERAEGFPDALVMTSGNLAEEPIAHEDDDARRRLGPLCDALLLHDRPIHVRCDDTVAATFRDEPCFIRRARGWAPLPLPLPLAAPHLMAAGGDLKNCFALARDGRAYLSHHVGDLEDWPTQQALAQALEHYARLFRVMPAAYAHDLHPDYHSTRLARRRAADEDRPALAVQHHHAHVAACMADNGLDGAQPVIGVAFDGTGYGDDGAIWGGEFLVADYAGYRRAAHLARAPLPGGDAAVRRPYRHALSLLREAGVPWDLDLAPVAAAGADETELLASQLATGVNAPPTSSAGRLFDAVASLAGVRHHATYEAQAACELEAAARAAGPVAKRDAYRFDRVGEAVDWRPVVRAVVADRRAGKPPPVVAARFHAGLAEAVRDVCVSLRRETDVSRVALSGGVWQNLLLLELAVARLERAGFAVLVHRGVPANDGGLALGQLAVAARRLSDGTA